MALPVAACRRGRSRARETQRSTKPIAGVPWRAMRAWLGFASQLALERLHKFDELTALSLSYPRIAVVVAGVRITVAGVRAE